ncbi:MAG: hypothetical protein ACK4UY_03775 [Dietzia sp.]
MSIDNSSLFIHEAWNWIEQRAAANVLYAKAVSDVEFDDGVLTIVFDPEGKAGSTAEAFYSRDQIPDIAAVFGSWIGSTDELGEWMRKHVTEVCAVKHTGERIQCVSGDELKRRATGDDSQP